MSGRRCAVISGAGGGVGTAVAHRLTAGFDLYLLGRNVARLENLAHKLTAVGGGVSYLAGDITDTEYRQRVVEAVSRCDVLVNSAGMSLRRPHQRLTQEDWHQVLDINVVAAAGLTSALIPAIRDSRGCVIMINSGAGQFSSPGNSVYSASKHALKAYTNSLRAEERARGVRVTSIFPGYMDTDMVRGMPTLKDPETAANVPWEGMVPVETLAETVAMVVSAPPQATFEDIVIRPTTPITIY